MATCCVGHRGPASLGSVAARRQRPSEATPLRAVGCARLSRTTAAGCSGSPRASASDAGRARSEAEIMCGRRNALQAGLATVLFAGTGVALPACAASLVPPPGYRRVVDKLEGYSFFAPSNWVTSAGAEVFFRNPENLEENFFVEISSPSSSNYATVADLGAPEDAAASAVTRYLNEFMSTRIGVRREASVVAARRATIPSGQAAYETDVRLRSFVNSNQLAVTPAERQPYLEWDRRLLAVTAVENGRLYELRLQVPTVSFDKQAAKLRVVMDSFALAAVGPPT